MTGRTNHIFVLQDCAEAYAYIMYFIPKLLKLDREDFMHRVNEEAIVMCADCNKLQDLYESESVIGLFHVDMPEGVEEEEEHMERSAENLGMQELVAEVAVHYRVLGVL